MLYLCKYYLVIYFVLHICHISFNILYIYCIEAENYPGFRRWFEIIFHEQMFVVIFVQLLSCYILYILYISYITLRPKTILVSPVGLRSYFMKGCQFLYLCNYYLFTYFILYIFHILYIILRPKSILVSAIGSRSYFMKVFCCYIFEFIILFYIWYILYILLSQSGDLGIGLVWDNLFFKLN